MKGFAPSFLDKLLAEPSSGAGSGTIALLNLEQLKDSVARDLEALLNTRAVVPEAQVRPYGELGKSVLTYGLTDFAGMSLASVDDRAFICRSLEAAISRHEPRLRNVRATLECETGSINRLNFGITALLVVNSCSEPVNFDAVLQPSSLHYSISKARSVTRIGI